MKTDTMKNISLTEDKKSRIASVFTGTLIAYAITCIAFIFCALLLRYTNFSENNVPIFVTISSVLAVSVAGFDSAKGASKNGWLWGMISGAIYAIILVCLGMWISDTFSFDGRTVSLVVLAIAGGGLGGVIGINFKK